jgi:predicted alpha/beta hydrolase family esterase
MQQVLFIWWWNAYPSRETFIQELLKRDYDPFEIKKRWRFTLQKELWDDYQVAILDMPNRTFALYKEWKIQFEKSFQYLNWNQIIIAHSLWTIFILKYLTENWFPKKIKQLHLVSALIDDKDLPLEENYIGDFQFDIKKIPEIEKICGKIFLYHSKDDFCVPFSQWERLHESIPNAKFEVFEGRGHMNMEEFPELIQNIKNFN